MRTGKVKVEGRSKGAFRAEFDSIDELAEHAFNTTNSNAVPGGMRQFDSEWIGADSPEHVREMTKHGWQDALPEALDIATEAVETVDREYELTMFKPFWDVSGCEVDVARYLSNEPENMIDYVMTPTIRSGRVVTICSSVCYSATVDTKTIIHRGRIVTALTLAVMRLGYGVELYADATVSGGCSIRTLVKSTNDYIDPAMIMYAYANPSFLRALILGWTDAQGESDCPDPLQGFGWKGGPVDPPADLPDGTLYLPGICWDGQQALPDPSEEVKKHLKELNIID